MEKDILNVRRFIQSVLIAVQSKLDKEAIDSVNHYLKYEEYEMAFEGLFLEIMGLSEVPQIDLLKSKEVGELLNLNKETIFDFEFWHKFKNYVDKNMNKHNLQ